MCSINTDIYQILKCAVPSISREKKYALFYFCILCRNLHDVPQNWRGPFLPVIFRNSDLNQDLAWQHYEEVDDIPLGSDTDTAGSPLLFLQED